MWICFIIVVRKKRLVLLDVDVGRFVFLQWRFCVDLCFVYGISFFFIKLYGDIIFIKYMLKLKIKIKFI